MALELIFWWPMRVRTRVRSRAKYKARAQALTTTRSTLAGFTKLNAESHQMLFNFVLYLILLDQDLADFTDNIVCAIGERRRTFFAKQEAVLLYEAAEDLPQLLGRDFRNALKALHISVEHQQNLNAVSSDLNKFWQTNREFLGNIRNALAAHREHDALRYLESLEQVKPLEVMQCAADLSGHLGRLTSVVMQIGRATNAGPAGILSDIIDSSKRKHAG
jgi:hypothetical protein